MKKVSGGACVLFVILLAFAIANESQALRFGTRGITYPPSFTVSPPERVYVVPNEPLILPCQVDAEPSAKYQWLANGQEANWIKPYYSHLAQPQIMPRVSQQFFNYSQWGGAHETLWYLGTFGITPEMKPGSYQCTAWNRFGRVVSSPTKVELAELGSFYDAREIQTTVKPDEAIRLNCSVSPSNPKPNIRWMVKSEDETVNFISESRTRATDDEGNLYVISQGSSKMNQKATFLCSVSNPLLRTIRTGPDIQLQFLPYSASRQNNELYRRKPYLVYHSPAKQVTLVNKSLSLKCIVGGNPLPLLVWQWTSENSQSEMNSTGFQSIYEIDTSFGARIRNEGTELFIGSIQPKNAGIYRCLITTANEMSPMLTPLVSYEVSVEGEPVYLHHPTNTIVPISGSTELHCMPDAQFTKPPAVITWLINGNAASNYFNNKRRFKRQDVIYISNATSADTAVFQCKLTNKHGIRISNAYLHVWQQPPGIIIGPSKEHYAADTQMVHLPCKTLGAPEAEVKWTKNGQPLNMYENHSGPSRYIRGDDGLYIQSVKMADSGIYTCIATNRFGSSQVSGRLVVRKRTEIISGPRLKGGVVKLSSNSKLDSIHVENVLENTTVHLYCEARTDPAEMSYLQLFWMKSGQIVGALPHRLDSRVTVSQDGSSLNISPATPKDSGLYTCVAKTRLDNDSSTLKILVQGKPDPPTNLRLSCQQNEHQAPFGILTWEVGDENNSPVVNAVVEYVAGAYRPLAKNLTEYRSEVISEWERNPHPHSNTSVSRRNSLSHYQMIWMRDSREKALQMIRKCILSEHWSRAELLGKKNVGKRIRMIGEQSLAALVLPQMGSNLVSKIDEARVRLYGDAIYHFRVRLENAAGLSEPSDIIPKLGSDECHTIPQPSTFLPNELLVFGSKPRSLIVKWQPIPAMKHNGPGLIYILTVTCLDCMTGPLKPLKNVTTIDDWTVGEVEFESLITTGTMGDGKHEDLRKWDIETFRAYEVSLTTKNIFGSNISAPRTQIGHSGENIPDAVPEAPKVTEIGPTSVTLTWKKLSLEDIDKTVHGYFRGFRVEWCEAGMKEQLCDFYKTHKDYIVKKVPPWSLPHLRVHGESKNRPEIGQNRSLRKRNQYTPIRADSNARIDVVNDSYVAQLTDLPGKTKLKIWLRVLNIQYCGPASEAVYVSTTEGVPEAVPEITTTFVGVNHVELTWVKPLRANGFLTGYDLEVYYAKTGNMSYSKKTYEPRTSKSVSSSEAFLRQMKINDSEQLAVRISGLHMDTEYVVSIWPKTGAGRGAESTVQFRTARVVQDSGLLYFSLNALKDSPSSVNVCLSRSLENALGSPIPQEGTNVRASDNKVGPSRHNHLAASQTGGSLDDDRLKHPKLDSLQSWQNEQVLNPTSLVNVKQAKRTSKLDMFYAQFRKVHEEFWEETQREFQNPWIILTNLASDEEYEVRIVYVKSSGQSIVSTSRFFRVPMDIGITLSNDDILPKTDTVPDSLTVIGSICILLILLTSVVSAVFLACWCRRRTRDYSVNSQSESSAKSRLRSSWSGIDAVAVNSDNHCSVECEETKPTVRIPGADVNVVIRTSVEKPVGTNFYNPVVQSGASNDLIGAFQIFPYSVVPAENYSHPLPGCGVDLPMLTKTYKL